MNVTKETIVKKNDIEMYSTHNKWKSVIAERFFRTLKNKIHEYMTSVSKNVYIDKLDDIVNKHNNTYHTTSKATPDDLRSNTFIDSSIKVNGKNLKFKICDNFRMSKYKIAFAKFTLQIGLNKFLWLKKLKILYRRHISLMILMEKSLLKYFTKTNCKKQIKINLQLKK